MVIPHEYRLYQHVGPDGIPCALVVVHDMFNLLELLGKISAILDYSNSMLPHVNADGAIGYPIGFLRQYNVYASLKTEFSKNKEDTKIILICTVLPFAGGHLEYLTFLKDTRVGSVEFRKCRIK